MNLEVWKQSTEKPANTVGRGEWVILADEDAAAKLCTFDFRQEQVVYWELTGDCVTLWQSSGLHIVHSPTLCGRFFSIRLCSGFLWNFLIMIYNEFWDQKERSEIFENFLFRQVKKCFSSLGVRKAALQNRLTSRIKETSYFTPEQQQKMFWGHLENWANSTHFGCKYVKEWTCSEDLTWQRGLWGFLLTEGLTGSCFPRILFTLQLNRHSETTKMWPKNCLLLI